MKAKQPYLIGGLVTAAAAVVGVIVAPTAVAECQSSGGATVCAQGSVRGSGQPAPSTGGVYYPYPCQDDWLCGDGGVTLVFGGGDGGGGGGNRPGGGGGIIGGGGGIGPR